MSLTLVEHMFENLQLHFQQPFPFLSKPLVTPCNYAHLYSFLYTATAFHLLYNLNQKIKYRSHFA